MASFYAEQNFDIALSRTVEEGKRPGGASFEDEGVG